MPYVIKNSTTYILKDKTEKPMISFFVKKGVLGFLEFTQDIGNATKFDFITEVRRIKRMLFLNGSRYSIEKV